MKDKKKFRERESQRVVKIRSYRGRDKERKGVKGMEKERVNASEGEREKHCSCDSVSFVRNFKGLVVPRDQSKSSKRDRVIRPELDDRKI